jgi:hypothetical protein
MPSESKALYTLVDPGSPPYELRRATPLGEPAARRGREYGGGAGYCPRVRMAYYDRVYRHSRTNPAPCI